MEQFFQSASHSFIQALFALSVCVKRHTLCTLTDTLESNVLAQSVMWAECYFSLFSDDSLLTSYIDSKLFKVTGVIEQVYNHSSLTNQPGE